MVMCIHGKGKKNKKEQNFSGDCKWRALKCYQEMNVGDKCKAYVHFNDNECAWNPA